MEVKERRPYCSLSKSRKDKEGPYTGEAADSPPPPPTVSLTNIYYLYFLWFKLTRKKNYLEFGDYKTLFLQRKTDTFPCLS